MLAPSADNRQPWRLRYEAARLDVFHDPRRAILYDTHFRASLLAIGALIENVVLAAFAAGYFAEVEYFPAGLASELVARLTFDQRGRDESGLSAYIESRTTNRKFYQITPLTAFMQTALRESVGPAAGVDVYFAGRRSLIRQYARLVFHADRLRYQDQAFHEELMRAIRFSRVGAEQAGDGLLVKSLEVGWPGEVLLRAIRPWRVASRLNRVGLSRVMAFHSYRSVLRSGAIAVITAPQRNSLDYVRGGRGVERFLLRVASLGLSVQPLSLGTLLCLDIPGTSLRASLTSLRTAMETLLPTAREHAPLMLVRLGHSDLPSARSPRRRLEEVFSFGPAEGPDQEGHPAGGDTPYAG